MSEESDFVAAIINDARARALEASDKSIEYTDSAVQAANTYLTNPPSPADVAAETFLVPPFTPNIQLGDTFKSDFDSVWAGMEGWVRGLMADYVNTFFPVLDPAIQTTENKWLLDVINLGYVGIPVATETAIWERARGKDTLEALRMEEEATMQFASRGFSLPPGVLANRLQAVQQEAANKSSTIARELAIKQADISVEMTKFAIGEMSKLRLGIASALADFMRAWMTLPAAAAEIARAKSELHKQLWDSSAGYIQALVSKASLKLTADKSNQDAFLESQKLALDTIIKQTNVKVQAATAAAGLMGGVASAALASQNTIAHVGAVNNTAT
jgi:hypothetical protein